MREEREKWIQGLREERNALRIAHLPLGLANLMIAFEEGWEARGRKDKEKEMFTEAQEKFLKEGAIAAVGCERQTGVPARISLAQAVFEGGWSEGVGFNCFGMKMPLGAISGGKLLPTQEWFTPADVKWFLSLGRGRTAVPAHPLRVNGTKTLYDVEDWFQVFPSLEAAFAAHSSLLRAGRYAKAWATFLTNKNVEGWFREIGSIYSTTKGYADIILGFANSSTVRDALSHAQAGVS